MRLTLKLLGAEVFSAEFTATVKPCAEPSKDRTFGFHGGKGPSLNERAPATVPQRRAKEKPPVNPS
mgnify:CR=1 FL=1